MKLNQILIPLFLLVGTTSLAQSNKQDSLIQHYNKYPQQAIENANSRYKQAIKDDNHELLIKSLILKTTFTLKINSDEYPRMIKELETYIINNKNVQVKSILHSYLGQVYQMYYSMNGHQIDQRSVLKGNIPDDINVWSSNLFLNKISEHLFASISSQENLQQTPISDFKEILIIGESSEKLRPTLYDFLCHRAIGLFSDLRYSNTVKSDSLDKVSEILSPIQTFLSYDIPITQLSPDANALRVWQEMLRFRQQKSNSNTEALLFADLERLENAYRVSLLPTKDSLYLQTLTAMQKEYIGNPMLVEIIAKEAQCLIHPQSIAYQFRSSREQANKVNKERALAICEKGIQTYPNYHRINILKKIVQEIKAPQINVEFARHLYPKDTLSLKIKYKNLRFAEVFIYQIHANTLEYKTKEENSHISKTLVYQNKPTLDDGLMNQDTLIFIPIQKSGLYEVVIKVPNAKKDISSTFICSELFSTNLSTSEGFRFRVYDWQSGKPISKAKIYIYKGYSKYLLIDSTYTNTRGFASLKTNDSRDPYYYEVVNPNNPNGPFTRIYPAFNEHSKVEQSTIITDRKIYRPGQLVQFKIYTWKENTDSIYALANKQSEIIFRDANNKEIAKKQLHTNKFGSSSGSFVIPEHTLNGRFSISTSHDRAYIQVADYNRPEFEIIFSQEERTYYHGDTVRIKGEVKSFSGSNISNSTVSYTVSNDNLYSSYTSNIIKGTTQTDANGAFELSFKAKDRQEANRPRPLWYPLYGYQVNVKITDSNGETQENNINIPIYNNKASAIIDIPKQVNKNKTTAFHISFSDFPSNDSTKVQYSLDQLVPPNKIIPKGSGLSDTIIAKHILKGKLYIQESDSIVPKLSHLPSGAYLFTVHCDNNITKTVFYLYSPKDKRPPVPTYEWLVIENDICKVGDTAHILFGTSALNTYVDIDIYTHLSKKIEHKTLRLSNEVTPIKIPYLARYGKQITLNISYVKDKQFISEVATIQRKADHRKLTIFTSVFRDKLLPGEEEKWEVKVETHDKKTPPTELLAMMYDASLDKITPYSPYINLQHQYPNLNLAKPAFSTTNRNYRGISSWGFKRQQLSYPAFQFDKLELFSRYQYFADYGDEDYAEEDINIVNGEILQGKLSKVDIRAASGSSNEMSKRIRGTQSPKIELRQNFQETAFFYPQLQTDSSGTVSFKFKVPDALTKWKFIAIANTPNMAIGQIKRYVTTSKPLMIRPNLARFFRSGDQANIKVTISNLSDTIQKGMATIEFLTANNKQVIYTQQQKFDVAAQQNQTVDFHFNVPENMEFTICRITASSGNFSDGEQHLIPILPDETLITETLPIYMNSIGEKAYSFDKNSRSKENYRLTFELSSNPIWYAVLALPTLTEPSQNNVTDIAASYYVNSIAANIARSNPHIIETIQNWKLTKDDASLSSKLEQNSELKSILLEASPWVMQAQNESERMQSLAQLFDENRLNYLQTQALKKLADLQTPSGGWSWFKGMYPSRFMTLNVLTILQKTSLIAQVQYGEQEKMMQIKALRYIDNQIKKDFETPQKRIDSDQIIYLYTRSLYRDIPLGDALDAHKHLMSLALKQWSQFSLYDKALIAITLKNYGFTKEAKNVLKSLRQYAITDPTEGMYWPNNRNAYYRNSAVLKHTAIMEAFQEIEGNSPEINQMKQWLLRQKQVQNWGSVPATVNAIYALLLTGDDQLSSTTPISIKLGKHSFKTDTKKNPLGYIKKSYQAESIQANMLSVEITKESNTPSWGAMYLQYFEKLDKVKSQKTALSVNKELFIATLGANGKQELSPIDKQELKIGSKVMIRLTLSLNSDMEFLHLKDLRAACFEPIEQLSGIHWNFSSVYYQDTKDAATHFFFNSLARGTYVIEYPVWVNQSGTYQDGIATFQSIYSPEFNAFSSATKIEIK